MDQAETLRHAMANQAQVKLNCQTIGNDATTFPMEAFQSLANEIDWVSAPDLAHGLFVVLSPSSERPVQTFKSQFLYVAVNGVTNAQDARELFEQWAQDFNSAQEVVYLGHLPGGATDSEGQVFPRGSKRDFLLGYKKGPSSALQFIAKRLKMATQNSISLREGRLWV